MFNVNNEQLPYNMVNRSQFDELFLFMNSKPCNSLIVHDRMNIKRHVISQRCRRLPDPNTRKRMMPAIAISHSAPKMHLAKFCFEHFGGSKRVK